MLKSSSLCLSSSNLGTFWLKIEQGDEIKKSSSLKLLSQSQPNFAEMILRWSPFKIVSVGYRTVLPDTILKGDHLRIISAKFG
jgi:hypothetical protein